MGRLLTGLNHLVSRVSDELVAPLTADGQAVRYSMTSPRVIISTFRATPKAATLSLDLRRSRYTPLAIGELEPKAFQLQLARGVVDGVVEAHLLDWLLSPAAGKPGVRPGSYSTWRVFDAAARAGVKPVLSRGTA